MLISGCYATLDNNATHRSSNLIFRKPLQGFCHVAQYRCAIARSSALMRVSCDVVRHSLADTSAVGDLLERVSPSVIWQKLWVRNAQVTNPISKSLSNLVFGDWSHTPFYPPIVSPVITVTVKTGEDQQ